MPDMGEILYLLSKMKQNEILESISQFRTFCKISSTDFCSILQLVHICDIEQNGATLIAKSDTIW